MHEHSSENPDQPVGEAQQGEPERVPRIYVVSLADRYEGREHGRWLDADQEPQELAAGVDQMLASSPHPTLDSWAIHDYQNFEGIRIDEFANLLRVAQLAAGLRKHGSAFAAFVRWYDEADNPTSQSFERHFGGHWDSLEAYAIDLLADTDLEAILDAAVPGCYRAYVQFDAHGYGRDLALNGDIATVEAEEGGVYVFHPNA